MTDNTQELDKILAAKFATKPDGGAWCTFHLHKLEVGVCRSCEAKQAILDWHNKQVEEVLDRVEASIDSIEASTGIDGFHSDVRELQDHIEAERNKLKG